MARECPSAVCECTGWCGFDTDEEWLPSQGIDDMSDIIYEIIRKEKCEKCGDSDHPGIITVEFNSLKIPMSCGCVNGYIETRVPFLEVLAKVRIDMPMGGQMSFEKVRIEE